MKGNGTFHPFPATLCTSSPQSLPSIADNPAATARTPARLQALAAPKTPAKPASSAAATAAKTPSKSVSRARCLHLHGSENTDPNILASPPAPASKATLAAASVRRQRSTPGPAPPPPGPHRRFLVVKKGAHRRRHNNGGDSGGGEFDFDKCRQAAREALRASHEEFFLRECAASAATEEEESKKEEEEEGKATDQEADSGAFQEGKEGGVAGLEGSSKVRAIRSRVMAKALNTVPDSGAANRWLHAIKSG